MWYLMSHQSNEYKTLNLNLFWDEETGLINGQSKKLKDILTATSMHTDDLDHSLVLGCWFET